MPFTCLNAYEIMWLIVFFDLPVTTAKERRHAAKFRKDLLKDGFTMMQFSVYIRHCASRDSMEVHENRIKELIPPKGQVSILAITDKQFGDIKNFWGAKETPAPKPPAQLELF